jgi:hypothetical protein
VDGVGLELLAQALVDGAVADEQQALGLRAAAGDRAGQPARQQRPAGQRGPEDDDLPVAQRAVDEEAVRQPDQQRVEGRELEERRGLVERALVDHQLVAVVEAVELGGHDHEREREQDAGRRRSWPRTPTQSVRAKRAATTSATASASRCSRSRRDDRGPRPPLGVDPRDAGRGEPQAAALAPGASARRAPTTDDLRIGAQLVTSLCVQWVILGWSVLGGVTARRE